MGSLIAAVASYLDARHHGGTWLVRMEDIDPPREQAGAAEAILSALRALGVLLSIGGVAFALGDAVLVGGESPDQWLGALAVLASAFCAAIQESPTGIRNTGC